MHDRRLKFLANKLQEPLTKEQRTAIQAEIKQVTTLKNDAMTIKASMKARIENIHKMMPVRSKTVSDIELRQSLVLEKLLNNPTLFTDTGRPYKNPWTYRHTNTIKSIEVMKDNQLLITLDNKIDPNMTAFLNRHGASIEHSSPKQLVITREKLAALRENMLHPETQLQFQADKNYLDKNDLEMISKAYDKGHRTKIMQTVDDYVKVMKKKPVTDDEKRAAINQATVSLMEHISTAKDKGFGMQVMKKLHFDIQQQLQMMIPAHQKPANLDEAFAAAIKLDRIADFNMVVNEAIHNNKLASPAFRDFLQGCIDKATLATNHQEAIDRSAEIPQMAALTVHQFKQKPAVDLMLHEDLGLIHQVDELDGIRLPVAIRLEELSDEANLLSDVAKSDVLIVEHQASPEELEKKSGEHPKDNTI